MTVFSQKKNSKKFVFLNYNLFLCGVILFIILKNNVIMYISSVVVVFAPKSLDSGHLSAVSLSLDCRVGCTLFHTVEYVSKHPLIKPYLNKYVIVNLSFQYSKL